MPKPLVIVESPAKATRIGSMLGHDYVVESSVGHVRDLPEKTDQIPAEYRDRPWARGDHLGIDVDNDFKPFYVVTKREQVRKLKALLKDASELYLATDEDREGESIAWHLLQELAPRVPVRRMVFHEITQAAIERAVAEPRELDERLVDAQETRRIFDRLYGYGVSPVLWRRVNQGLSAGRVQSVAVRLLVERERERMAFRSVGWWDLEGTFAKDGSRFSAGLAAVNGQRVVTGRYFNSVGELVTPDVVRLDGERARALGTALADASFSVRSVEEKPYRRSPAAPFMTSTFQQEAGRKLGMTARRAMDTAQRLYENGLITYMRTDSTTLSETALTAARQLIRAQYGPEYLPDKPRLYAKKVKNAQEAHEAIRPAGETFRMPDDVRRSVSADEARVYELIWKRTVASQMTDAVGRTVSVRLGATASSGEDAEFSTSGTVFTFPGFRRAYVEGADDPEAELADQERPLPELATGDAVDALELLAKDHATTPPARYTEASLVKRLVDLGIGRPSTYASIIDTITNRRGYARKRGSALIPTFTAFAVTGLLEDHFDQLVDYALTANMEDDLDRIANGEEERIPWLRRFYFGNGQAGLRSLVSEERLASIDAAEVNTIPIGEDENGTPIVVRSGRYGPYVKRGDDTASVPEEMAPDEVTVERALELLAAPSGDRELGDDPETGLPVVAKTGRYGPYVQLGELEPGSTTKVPTASLLSSMTLDTITLDDALRLLSLPRVIGADPADGVEITAQNGRYGPFIKKGTDSRSLEREEQMFTISLGEALAIFAEPKRRRGQRAPAEPLKTLGPDPVSGAPVVLREGRFGPYVTDGETNASLRAGDTIETITMDRAAELLADRRAAGPSKGRRAKKTGAKKTGAKKTVAKQSAAKKTVAKKSAAKKAAPRKAAVKKGAVKNGAAKRAAPKMSAANTAAPESASPENTPVDPPEA